MKRLTPKISAAFSRAFARLRRPPRYWFKIAVYFAALVCLPVMALEAVLWRSGYGNFPVYETDELIGYIPKPGTAGMFAERYPFYFNERSMRNQPFRGDPTRDLLLLGDSIVFGGGITFQPEERLGACLERVYDGGQVWAASAGSWAAVNELTYLERNPEVVDGVKRIVWILNSADLGGRTQWKNPDTHPKAKPVWLGWYLFNKVAPRYVGRIWPGAKASASSSREFEAPVHRESLELLAKMPDAIRGKTVFLWYPNKREAKALAEGEVVENYQRMASAMASIGLVLNPFPFDQRWGDACYMDSIHPNPEGNRVLASMIAGMLEQAE